MGIFRFNIAMSLDGFCAGPEQSVDDPLGIGGMQLHQWAFELEEWRESHGLEGGEANDSSDVIAETTENVGAVVMGRNMFGGGPGPWNEDEPWNGWWGDDPPFHVPVYVLTHHPREPLAMEGGTTFHFVTDGIRSAFDRAREAAGDADVSLGGGGSVVHQYLAAGLLDEIQVNLVPVILGGGTRLFDDLADSSVRIEQVRVVETPNVTHLKYRVVK